MDGLPEHREQAVAVLVIGPAVEAPEDREEPLAVDPVAVGGRVGAGGVDGPGEGELGGPVDARSRQEVGPGLALAGVGAEEEARTHAAPHRHDEGGHEPR